MKIEDLKSLTELVVFKDLVPVGTLVRTKSGVTFQYLPQYLEAKTDSYKNRVFFNLPLKNEAYQYRGENLPPEFAGLLPEGLRLQALLKSAKTSPDDLFSLAAALGDDVPGDIAVSIDELGKPQKTKAKIIEPFENVDFIELYQKSLFREDLIERNFDTSFSGVQAKLSARIISFPTSVAGRNKRYILKLPSSELEHNVRNEYFFMSLAKEAKLSVAEVSIANDRLGREALLVQRFDRVYNREKKRFIKLHTEDACQLLSRYPQDKYRLSFREVADGIVKFSSSSILELTRLLELFIYSYVIGNGDLHAKNISLIVDLKGRVRLSPAYDLLSTLPYGDQSMALLFEGKDKRITRELVRRFSDAYEIPFKGVSSRIERICKTIERNIFNFSETGLDSKRLRQLQSHAKAKIDGLCG